MADFVVSDDKVIAEMEERELMIESSMPSVLNLRDDSGFRQEKRFRLSSDIVDGSDDVSLPDVDELIARVTRKEPARKRRIINDSDDD